MAVLNRYRAFGLTLESELVLPEVAPTHNGVCDVRIQLGATPSELPEITDRGVVYATNPREFLLTMEGVGRYLVSDGRTITVEPEAEAAPEDLRLFLLGSCFGALLHQRGVLVLNASGVVVEGQAVLFAGVSGSGKSTLAAAFQQRGYDVLCDDLAALTLESGQVVAQPGARRLKLWRDAVRHLKLEEEALRQVRPGTLHRLVVPLDKDCQPAVCRAVFILGHWNQENFDLQSYQGLSGIHLLLQQVYRRRFLSSPDHFGVLGPLAAQAPVYLLRRPDVDFRLDELVEVVLEKLA